MNFSNMVEPENNKQQINQIVKQKSVCKFTSLMEFKQQTNLT